MHLERETPMKLDIAFLVPGLPFDGDTIKTQSLGGSETAGYYVAREMAARGHNVWVFSNIEQPGVFDGVVYSPLGNWQTFAASTPLDAAIVQRVPNMFMAPTNAKLNVLWCHDLPSGRSTGEVRGVAWNVDRVAVVSDMMADAYAETYGLPHSNLWVARNGIDTTIAKRDDTVVRNRKELICAARPERGFDVLLSRIMPRLLAADPDITLTLYGYHNPVEHLAGFYAGIGDTIRALPEGSVRHGGELDKAALYDAYRRGGVYVYPTPSPIMPTFVEVSCISVMEAQACGLPIVTSARGALAETIAPDAGVLIDGDPMSDDYADQFCAAVLRYIDDDAVFARAQAAGAERAETLDWTAQAEFWERSIEGALADLNDSQVRRAVHFYKHSAVEAALQALDEVPEDETAKGLRAKILRDYAFIQSDAAIAEHYRAGGVETDERLTAMADPVHMFKENHEPRFSRVIETLITTTQPDALILDYGCGHGWFSVFAHNQIGRRWLGVDLDPGAVKWSRTYAERHGNVPEDLRYVTTAEFHAAQDGALCDAAVCSEVLEHVRDPWTTILDIEARLKPGSPVIITVPLGPTEFGTYNWFAFRNHIWHFETHDVEEMFGGKPDFDLNCIVSGKNEITGDPIGSMMIRYISDGKALGPINRVRKQALQRPRQTVSASMICGGPMVEETLHWCLRSLAYFVDEIVIGNAGMSDEALRIANQYGARIVPARNPLEHGFEAARNDSLDACRMDWVLWIDADERLVDGHMLAKYLRDNLFDGYAIRQHHFTCDASMKADTPVRLFRRDRGIKFFGMIHEHPEKGVNAGPGEIIILSDVHIAHVGYLSETIRRGRFNRNHPLLIADEAKYPDRKLQKYMRMRDNDLLTMYECQNNGNVVTPEAKARAQETVDLYRKYFLGQSGYIGADALAYYGKALEILGQGVDISFALGVSRDGVGEHDDKMTTSRFADYDEAMVEVAHRLKEKFNPIQSKWW